MELTNLNQIEFSELKRENIDCLISAAGSQPRCYFLAEKLHTRVAQKLLLITGTEDPKNSGKYLSVFEGFGFQNYIVSQHVTRNVDRLLHELCNLHTQPVNLVIDYSCMPKKWYSMIIDGITRNNFLPDRLNIFLSYTPKIFERKPVKHAVSYCGPMIMERDNLKDKKPVSMIVSLDNNNNTVMEAVSKVKPGKLLAFIPNCTHDPDYARLVRDNNRSLLEKMDSRNVISYDVDRPEEINAMLTSRCLDERVDSEVVILPQGPKTFSMMSMLLSVRYPDVKLWEIILKDPKYNPGHGYPAANPIIVKVSFINDELD